MTEKLKLALGRVENIVGRGENAGYQHFLLFPQCFQKTFLMHRLKWVNSLEKILNHSSWLKLISNCSFLHSISLVALLHIYQPFKTEL